MAVRGCMWWAAVFAGGLGCGSGAVGSLDDAHAEQAGVVQLDEATGEWIRTEPVSASTVPTRIDAPGRVVVLQDAEARLAVPVEGRVREVHVREGARVEAGAPLVTLESGEAARLRAEVAASEVEVRVAEAERARQERLATSGVGLAVERLRAEADVRRARAGLDAARHAAEVLGDGVGGRVVLRAPLAGVVVGLDARPGQGASPDAGPLVSVAQTEHLHVRLDVYEDALRRVRVGQRVEVGANSGDAVVPGRVIEVADAADPRNRRGPVLVELDEVPEDWVAGRMIRGRIDADPVAPIGVPVSAVVLRPDRTRVVYVEEEGRLVQRPVDVGRVVDGRVPVIRGLSPADRVVVEGALLVDAMADRML